MNRHISCPSCDQKTYDNNLGHCSDEGCSYHLTKNELIARINRIDCNKISDKERGRLLQMALKIISG